MNIKKALEVIEEIGRKKEMLSVSNGNCIFPSELYKVIKALAEPVECEHKHERMKVKCPFCKQIVELKDVLEGLNVHKCPNCKEGIVWNNQRREGKSKLTADKDGIKLNSKVIIKKIEEANMI